MVEPTRRWILATIAGVVSMAAEQETLAWDYGFPAIDGGRLELAALKGRVLLVTNTASFCGYTYQYEALEKLHNALSPRGLTVIGVPSQDFNQESPDNATVKTFCSPASHMCAERRRRRSMPGCARSGSGSRAGISTRC
jgi:glutathione peroxidase